MSGFGDMQIATSYKTRQSADEYAERLMPYGTTSDTLPSVYRTLFRTDITVTHLSFRYFIVSMPAERLRENFVSYRSYISGYRAVISIISIICYRI